MADLVWVTAAGQGLDEFWTYAQGTSEWTRIEATGGPDPGLCDAAFDVEARPGVPVKPRTFKQSQATPGSTSAGAPSDDGGSTIAA